MSKTVCVLGLGYIGLPTASMLATHGHKVRGVDVNARVISMIQKGQVHIEEPGLDGLVKDALASGNLVVDGKPGPADVFIIAVPTPYQNTGGEVPEADMSFVKKALEHILPHLKKGDLVILESTSPPGTTRDMIVPMIEKAGFTVGKDIGVAYCPERVIPGQALKELAVNDRVVGAIDPAWGEKTRELYQSFVTGEIFLTDPTAAEMIKISENTYRDVNIALANQMALVCEKLGISVWEVIRIANRHPRVNLHKPGPGVGGHCIGVDPWFLVEKFPKETELIHTARKVNSAMPHHVVEVAGRLLQGKKDPKIAVLGLAYKGNVDDIRESPAVEILKLLQKKYGPAQTAVFEPHIKPAQFPTQSLEDTFQEADIALLLTAHDEYKALDPAKIGALMKTRVIYDTHNILDAGKWKAAGFRVQTLGMTLID